jgi:hypothetical protein
MSEGKNQVGRPRLLKSENELWELFERYKLAAKNNPRSKAIQTQTGLAYIPLEVPLTLVGFYSYCRKEIGSVHHYFEELDKFPEFRGICHAIREEIQQDQIEGGMVGIYNPSITQRLNGLVEKREENVKIEDSSITITRRVIGEGN